MSIISVSHLKKHYRVSQKEPGLTGSIKSLFNRKYSEVKAVEDIAFSIEEGELVGFIGPNGAGKTTTLKILSGLLYPDNGEVSVLGFNPYERKNEFLKNISLVIGQKNQLWWDLPPMETFLLNKEIYEVSQDSFKATLDELIKLLDVEDILKTPVRKLSLGQRMKCELIAALIHRPKVLFLDEPTIGLDVMMQKVLRDFIQDYNHRFHATILLTSHYMDDVKELCKRVIVIDHGKIIYDGSLAKIVHKYVKYKTISLVLNKEIDIKKLDDYGEIDELKFPKVVYKVLRKNVAKTTSNLLKFLPVEDLNIEEPQIEDVIRNIFSGKDKL